MKQFAAQIRLLKCASVSVAVLAAFGLAACGGGDDGDSSHAGASLESGGATGGAPRGSAAGGGAAIKVEGTSQSLSGELANVLVPPVAWKADGSFPTDFSLGRDKPVSALREQEPGAYVGLPKGDGELSLSAGTVTDLAGNGEYAIGRWTNGSDSGGGVYNANQGRAWAAGVPADVTLESGASMSCSLVASTRPTATDGNTAPGTLDDATAIVTARPAAFGDLKPSAALTLRYSIGADQGQTFAGSTQVSSTVTSKGTRSSMMTSFVGNDPLNPYLVVAYGVAAPTTGGVNGVAVLRCK